MKIFKFSFEGMALGGEIVVIARGEKTATREALVYMNQRAHTSRQQGSLKLESVTEIERYPVTVHFWDGDY